jgi:hypothetical protein
VADPLWPGVGFDPVFVDWLGQLVVRKLGEGTAEGRFAGNLPRTFPTTEWAPQRPGLQGVQERTGGGELINVLGDESVRQPSARTGWATVAAPFVTTGEAAQIGERNDLAELLIQGAQGAGFGRKRGEKWPLQMVKNRRQAGPEEQTPRTPSRSIQSNIFPPQSLAMR